MREGLWSSLVFGEGISKDWKHRCPGITNTQLPWTEARADKRKLIPFLARGTCKLVHGGRARLSSAAAKADPAVQRDAGELSERSPLRPLRRGLWWGSKHRHRPRHPRPFPQHVSKCAPGKFLTDTVTWVLTRTSGSHLWCPYNRLCCSTTRLNSRESLTSYLLHIGV